MTDDELKTWREKSQHLRELVVGMDPGDARSAAAFAAGAMLGLANRCHTLGRENNTLMTWISDLQSGMYINCVYCGHCYGPKESTPVTMADMLKAHIEQCPKHPLAAAMARIRELEADRAVWAGLARR